MNGIGRLKDQDERMSRAFFCAFSIANELQKQTESGIDMNGHIEESEE